MNAHANDMITDQIGPLALRDVLGHFPTGVAIVTTLGDDGVPVGLAANSFASVSLDPPLVVWSLSLNAPSLGAFRTHSSFAVNIMCDGSKNMVLNFSRPRDDKFSEVDWVAGLDGVPVLNNASAVLECRTENRFPGGDHEMYLGRVMAIRKAEKPPLIFHKGQFSRLGVSL